MTLAVTSLAPFVNPVAYEAVCSVHGVRFVVTDAGGSHVVDAAPGDRPGDGGAHCPMCIAAGVPPRVVAWDATPDQPLAPVRRSVPAARLASLVGAPLPARGPPSAS